MKNKVESIRLNYDEVIKIISGSLSIDKNTVKSVIDGYISCVNKALKNGIEVSLPSLGAFVFKEVEPRPMKMYWDRGDYKRGDIIMTKGGKRIAFKVSPTLYNYVKENTAVEEVGEE